MTYLQNIMETFTKNSVDSLLIVLTRHATIANSFEKIGVVTKTTVHGPTKDKEERPHKHYVCRLMRLLHDGSQTKEFYDQIIDETLVTGEKDSKLDIFIYPLNDKMFKKLTKIFAHVETTLKNLLNHQQINAAFGFYPIEDLTQRNDPNNVVTKKSIEEDLPQVKTAQEKFPQQNLKSDEEETSKQKSKFLKKTKKDKRKDKGLNKGIDKKIDKRKDKKKKRVLLESSDEEKSDNHSPSLSCPSSPLSPLSQPSPSSACEFSECNPKKKKTDEDDINKQAKKGIIPEVNYRLWTLMSDKDKKMFISSERTTGISFKKTAITKKGTARNTCRKMCALYKSLTPVCRSRTINDGVYQSEEASFVHASYFGSMKLRMTNASSTCSKLKHNALCPRCKIFYDHGDDKYLRIVGRTQTCVICKNNCSSSAKNDSINEVRVCNKCYTKDHKYKLFESLNILKYIFPEFKVTVNKEESGHDGTKSVRADVIIRYKVKEKVGIIIIECDENQHQNSAASGSTRPLPKKAIKETDKTILEVASTFVKAFGQIDPSNMSSKQCEKVKCLFIRINPYARYIVSHISDKSSGKIYENYGTASRMMILRQWIIWHMTHIDEVRTLLCFFMFYDNNATDIYPHPKKYRGASFINRAPKPLDGMNWRYCADLSETFTEGQYRDNEKLFTQIIETRIDVNDMFNQRGWHIDSQDDKSVFPYEIAEKLLAMKHKT